jgi:hypothetical protein
MTAPQHFLNFLPLPQGQGSFLPGFILNRPLRLLRAAVLEAATRGFVGIAARACAATDVCSRIAATWFLYAELQSI